MELRLSEKLEFPVETIAPSVDISQIDNFSAFSAVRLAKRHFERNGFSVFEGGDFEDSFCMYFYEHERLFCDEYIKVKLGKSGMTQAKKEYCTKLLDAIPEPDIRLLLALCRFCSYTGDPGFPDMVLIKDGWQLAYVLFDQLSTSQQMFLVLSKLIGIDVMVVNLGMEEKEETLKIGPFVLFNSVLGENRAKNIMEGLEENIKAADTEDERAYLEDEKGKNPLFLFKRWKTQGYASASQLREAMHFLMTHNKHDFEKYLGELKNDKDFLSIAGKTEEAMKKRAEYMQSKLGIGRSRSKLMLNFF